MEHCTNNGVEINHCTCNNRDTSNCDETERIADEDKTRGNPGNVDQTLRHAAGFQVSFPISSSKHAGLIGLSPGNTYFTHANIASLLATTTSIFHQLFVLIPSTPNKHNYKAIGSRHAQKATRRSTNKLLTTLKEVQQSTRLSQSCNVIVIDWNTQIENNSEYQSQLSQLKDFFTSDNDFHSNALESTQLVLEKLANVRHSEGAFDLNEGVQYLLEEIASLFAIPKIFGVDTLSVIYHKHWPPFELLLQKEYYDFHKAIGFYVIE